jgi:hypothetical protein
MDQQDRLELTREVATVVAEVMAPVLDRQNTILERLVALEESHGATLARLVALQEHVIAGQERAEERQDKMLEALGLILEKLRRS